MYELIRLDKAYLWPPKKIFIMKLRFFLPAIALIVVAACNSTSDKKDNKTDSTATTQSHDSMNHNMNHTGGTVPALPGIPMGAKVFFKNLKDGQTITLPYKLEMGSEVMKVDTAGGPVTEGSGHHHLLIDAEDFLEAGTVVPTDSAHVHFGKGQTSYELKGLKPGKHKLVLQMADALHRSYGQGLTAVVNITVK